MTLIITMIGKNKVIQVADCRLTLEGKTCDADAIKSILVMCSDAQFSVGYTGLAEIEDKRTDYWLVEQIRSIFGSGVFDVRRLTWELATRLENVVPKSRYKGRLVKRENRGLYLVLAGYHDGEDGPKSQPFITTVSNMRYRGDSVPIGVASEFMVTPQMLRPGLPDNDFSVNIGGAWRAITSNDGYARETRKSLMQVQRQLRRVDLGERPSGITSVRRLVSVVGQASKHPKYGKLIGRDCLSVVIHPNNPMMGAYHHPEKVPAELRAPHMVTPWYEIVDAQTNYLSYPSKKSQAKEAERHEMRRRLAEYTVAHYDETRRQVAIYGPSDPEQIPHFFRDHKRMIVVTECADGYILSHRSDPYDRRNTPVPETFEIYTAYQDRTVGDVGQTRYIPFSNFRESMFPHIRENESGRYAPYANPEHQEGIEYISNSVVAQLTQRSARADAGREVREFFRRNPEVSS